jgi:hypothetical protein
VELRCKYALWEESCPGGEEVHCPVLLPGSPSSLVCADFLVYSYLEVEGDLFCGGECWWSAASLCWLEWEGAWAWGFVAPQLGRREEGLACLDVAQAGLARGNSCEVGVLAIMGRGQLLVHSALFSGAALSVSSSQAASTWCALRLWELGSLLIRAWCPTCQSSLWQAW